MLLEEFKDIIIPFNKRMIYNNISFELGIYKQPTQYILGTIYHFLVRLLENLANKPIIN